MSKAKPESSLEALVTATDENGRRLEQMHIDGFSRRNDNDGDLQRLIGDAKRKLSEKHRTTRVFVNRPVSAGNGSLAWRD